MKVCIGIPCNRQVRTKTVESLFNLEIPCEKIIIIATEGYTISENRNYLSVQAIKAGCTHLLFIDDDMVFPPDTLKRLLSHQKEIVGVVYHSRMFPPTPVVVTEEGQTVKVDGLEPLIKCGHVGGGVMLIDLEVFKKIERPWFTTKTHENGFTIMGEDAWFCSQARKAGYTIWCDTTLQIGHLGEFIY
jgi:GT2 family glycosyltransferase